jgi:hypothetical protein
MSSDLDISPLEIPSALEDLRLAAPHFIRGGIKHTIPLIKRPDTSTQDSEQGKELLAT